MPSGCARDTLDHTETTGEATKTDEQDKKNKQRQEDTGLHIFLKMTLPLFK